MGCEMRLLCGLENNFKVYDDICVVFFDFRRVLCCVERFSMTFVRATNNVVRKSD